MGMGCRHVQVDLACLTSAGGQRGQRCMDSASECTEASNPEISRIFGGVSPGASPLQQHSRVDAPLSPFPQAGGRVSDSDVGQLFAETLAQLEVETDPGRRRSLATTIRVITSLQASPPSQPPEAVRVAPVAANHLITAHAGACPGSCAAAAGTPSWLGHAASSLEATHGSEGAPSFVPLSGGRGGGKLHVLGDVPPPTPLPRSASAAGSDGGASDVTAASGVGDRYKRVDRRTVGLSALKLFKRGTADEALNSEWLFLADLEKLNLREIAVHGPKPGAGEDDVRGPAADSDLSNITVEWVSLDSSIVTEMRQLDVMFRAKGHARLRHVIKEYVDPHRADGEDARLRTSAFDWARIMHMSTDEAKAHITTFVSYIGLIPPDERGADKVWVERIRESLPPECSSELQAQMSHHPESFTVLATFCTTLRATLKALRKRVVRQRQQEAARAAVGSDGRTIAAASQPPAPAQAASGTAQARVAELEAALAAEKDRTAAALGRRQPTGKGCKRCGSEDKHPQYKCPSVNPCKRCGEKGCSMAVEPFEPKTCWLALTNDSDLSHISTNKLVKVNERRALDKLYPLVKKGVKALSASASKARGRGMRR